jgi:hypothetical protein
MARNTKSKPNAEVKVSIALLEIFAPKQELTMNVQQRNRRRGQDVEL